MVTHVKNLFRSETQEPGACFLKLNGGEGKWLPANTCSIGVSTEHDPGYTIS
jgi:hypothetical protein